MAYKPWLLVIARLQNHPHKHATTAMVGLRANQEKTNTNKGIIQDYRLRIPATKEEN